MKIKFVTLLTLITILVISCFSVICFTPTVKAETFTFGNSNFGEGTTDIGPSYMKGSNYECNVTGYVTSISLGLTQFSDQTPHVKAALYELINATHGNLIGYTEEWQITTDFAGFHSFANTSLIPVISGHTYIILGWADGIVYVNYDAGSTRVKENTETYSYASGFPEMMNFSLNGQFYDISAYVTVDTGAYEEPSAQYSLDFQSNIAVSYIINSSSNILTFDVPSPVTAFGINQTIAYAIANATEGVNVVVNIPEGDWNINQSNPKVGFGDDSGAIYINLQDLPSGSWLTLQGSGTWKTTTDNNGYLINCPSTVLRSTLGNSILQAPIIQVVGSEWDYENGNYTKSENRHVRITGLTILGYVDVDDQLDADPLSIYAVDGFLVDNCYFQDSCGSCISIQMSKGDIYNCTIKQLYHNRIGGQWGYGISVSGNSPFMASEGIIGRPTWIENVTPLWGKYDWDGIELNYSNPYGEWYNLEHGTSTYNYTASIGTTNHISFTAGPVYIENNYFEKCRHGITEAGYGYYVARNNYMTNPMSPVFQFFDVGHGAAFPMGRGAEIYNNVCNGSMSYGIVACGGTTLAYNNTFTGAGVTWTALLVNTGYKPEIPNNPMWMTDSYFWNNTNNNTSGTYGVRTDMALVAGEDYFLDTIAKDVEVGTEIAGTPTTPSSVSYTPIVYPNPIYSFIANSYYQGHANETLTLDEGVYVVSVPEIIVIDGFAWSFSHWQDNSNSTNFTVNLAENATIFATYILVADSGFSLVIISPTASTYSSSPQLIYMLNGSGLTIQYRLNSGDWVNIAKNTTLRYLVNGEYFLEMRVLDIEGQVVATDSVTFTIEKSVNDMNISVYVGIVIAIVAITALLVKTKKEIG